MNFSCDKISLLEALITAQKASANNAAQPILESILLKAEDTLKISGNNLEVAIECVIPANIYKEGTVAVNSKILSEIVRKLPEGIVHIDCDENYKVKIECGESNFDINGLPGDDFPEIPDIQGEETVTLTAGILQSLIKQTIYAVSQNESKPILTGVKFEITEGCINAIAVDGYRLAFRTENTDIFDTNLECVIPGRSLGELIKILKDDETQVQIIFTQKHALFQFYGCKFVTRLLEGEFLNYKNIIPKESVFKVEANVRDLIMSLERAALIAQDDGGKTPVKLNFTIDKLHINCYTNKGKVIDTLIVKTFGKDTFEIGFNHRFLLDALKATESEEVVIEFTGSINPAVIKDKNEDKYLFIVLPVRIKND